jgi:hypothetical protein
MQSRTRVDNAESIEEAAGALFNKALHPSAWGLHVTGRFLSNRCRVGSIEVCALIDVLDSLDTYLRVAFRGPKLSVLDAADLLEKFVCTRFLFVPSAEWMVEIDARDWIHFTRRYTSPALKA